MSARATALSLDPTLVMSEAGLVPDDWQRRVLTEPWSRALLCITRQGGKSTCTAALALHQSVFTPQSLTLLIAPSLRQSQELFKKVGRLYLDAGLHEVTRPDKESELRVRYENGSRIVVLPGSERTVRGFSGVDLLVLDEAARIEDELFYSVRPMLAISGGRLICLSTPFGRRGFFWKAWSGSEDYLRVQVPATECPRISADFLEEERRTLGSFWFKQEYMVEFLDPVDSLFSSDVIDRAFTSDLDALPLPPSLVNVDPGVTPIDLS